MQAWEPWALGASYAQVCQGTACACQRSRSWPGRLAETGGRAEARQPRPAASVEKSVLSLSAPTWCTRQELIRAASAAGSEQEGRRRRRAGRAGLQDGPAHPACKGHLMGVGAACCRSGGQQASVRRLASAAEGSTTAPCTHWARGISHVLPKARIIRAPPARASRHRAALAVPRTLLCIVSKRGVLPGIGPGPSPSAGHSRPNRMATRRMGRSELD